MQKLKDSLISNFPILDFWDFLIFWIFVIFWDFIFFKYFLKVTKVTTKSNWGYYWTQKMA